MSASTLTLLVVSSPSLGFPDWQFLGLYRDPEHAAADGKKWFDQQIAELSPDEINAGYNECIAYVGVSVENDTQPSAIICHTVVSLRELFPSYQFNRIFATLEEGQAFADQWYVEACQSLGLTFDGEDWLNTGGEIADILSQNLAVHLADVPVLTAPQL